MINPFVKKYLLIPLLPFTFIACSSNVENFHSTKSLGQQLEDLDKAYQSQSITEKEYKKAKAVLLDHY